MTPHAESDASDGIIGQGVSVGARIWDVQADGSVAEGAETRARHVARFHEVAAELRARIDWPVQRLRDERTRALRALVATAVERSPWHRRRLSGIDVDSLTDADLARLPTMTKSDLMGYSSFLPTVAREADAGRLRITPRRVVAISEPLLPEARAMIEQTWGAPVANGYGMSEGVFTGACGQSIHLPDDLCIVEPIDSNRQPAGRDEPGCGVLITNLYNPLLPLIRYEVSDELNVLDGTCPCGSAMTRIADPRPNR